MRKTSDQPLKAGHRSDILGEGPIEARAPVFDDLIRRLNKLEPGRRYMITIDITTRPKFSILDIGKIEG